MNRSVFFLFIPIFVACAGSAAKELGDNAQNQTAEGPGSDYPGSSASNDQPQPGVEAGTSEGPLGTKQHRVHSILPPAEGQSLQGIFDRLGVAPAACGSDATITSTGDAGTAWHVQFSGSAGGEADLTSDETVAVGALFDRLEVTRRNPGVTFHREDHTDCFPQNGVAVWRVFYDQDE